ncbi:expressed unknown protein [Seminavis robusta]|uniref:Uncharacterized protein n=1 Tax=Seminavis robusta TaxID=568900 RepID=A0A9N8DU81_9STRA|nr:expressed unknown protein [Seminavis robusta]|eukprot:Sro375_g129460.1 n/a (339) ;mRNA; r:40195-41407
MAGSCSEWSVILLTLLLTLPKRNWKNNHALSGCYFATTTKAQTQVRRANANATTFGAGITESCHDKRNPCAQGLSCIRAPSFWGLLVPRRVCFPLDCLLDAVNNFNDAVNVTDYIHATLQGAQVTPEEFFMQDQQLSASRVAKEMRTSPSVRRVMDQIRQHPIPQPQWNKYEGDVAACDPQSKLSTPRRNSFGVLQGPTTEGVTGLVGFGAGAGAGLGGGVEFFFGFPNANPYFFIDLGGGLLFGVDAGVSGFIGMAFTGTPSDIPGVGFELELQIPTPVVGPGIAVGVDLNPVWDLSVTLSVGAGIGVGGFSAGYTWGFPETSTADTNHTTDTNNTR